MSNIRLYEHLFHIDYLDECNQNQRHPLGGSFTRETRTVLTEIIQERLHQVIFLLD